LADDDDDFDDLDPYTAAVRGVSRTRSAWDDDDMSPEPGR
jgi:hypothetical protein